MLALQEEALATSGNYRRFTWWMEKYSHTINPRTGYPVQQDILGASVYAPTCMEADATRQRLWCWELKNLKIVLDNPHIEACFIYQK